MGGACDGNGVSYRMLLTAAGADHEDGVSLIGRGDILRWRALYANAEVEESDLGCRAYRGVARGFLGLMLGAKIRQTLQGLFEAIALDCCTASSVFPPRADVNVNTGAKRVQLLDQRPPHGLLRGDGAASNLATSSFT